MALFTGIVTDTGQFRFNSTSQRSFVLAGELVARGASPPEAGYELYERESAGKLRLLQNFLASLTMEFGGRVCIGTLPPGIFETTGTTAEDTEGLVDFARCVDGVDIGVLIEERPDGGSRRACAPRIPSAGSTSSPASLAAAATPARPGLNQKKPLTRFPPAAAGRARGTARGHWTPSGQSTGCSQP